MLNIMAHHHTESKLTLKCILKTIAGLLWFLIHRNVNILSRSKQAFC